MKNNSAYVRQASGFWLDLLNPRPDWTDKDLAIGLSRAARWGGHSVWPHPLSVAQHSIMVMELRRKQEPGLSREFLLRELLHDAEEGLMGFDPISPLKPVLGEAFRSLTEKLTLVVFEKYGVPAWTPETKLTHKRADLVCAATEAVYIAGWSPSDVMTVIGPDILPLEKDPLVEIYEETPWEPWAPRVAAKRFLSALTELLQK